MERYFNLLRKRWMDGHGLMSWMDGRHGWMNGPMDGQTKDNSRMKLSRIDYNYK